MTPAAKQGNKQPRRSTAERRSPRVVARQARELAREASRLLRKKGSKVPQEGYDTVRGNLEAVIEGLPARGHRDMNVAQVADAATTLNRSLNTYFRAFRKPVWREYAESIGWAIVLALIIRSLLFEAFSIPSGSMLPTLELGDHLFVNKIGYGLYLPFSAHRLAHWDEPGPGDIIVFEFRHKGHVNDGEDYIKRVVAGPGNWIKLRDNRLYLDGEPVPTVDEGEGLGRSRCPIFREETPEEPVAFCDCIRQREQLGDAEYFTQHMVPHRGRGPYDICGENRPNWPQHAAEVTWGRYDPDKGVEIPPGHVLVMGDNRDRSEDSRYWGLVPFDRIKGKAFVIWYAEKSERLFTWFD